MSKYDRITFTPNSLNGWNIYGWDKYPASSVLSGQDRKSFLGTAQTLEEAQEQYPEGTMSHPMIEPRVSFTHLN